MVKQGTNHNTITFGNSAEAYIANLFILKSRPNGLRLPDLVSENGNYNPRLALEVKESHDKGIMVMYQLHYDALTDDGFRFFFGDQKPSELFSGAIQMSASRLGDAAYYYCVPNRVDGLSSHEARGPFASIKCEFGDIHMVPGRYAFYVFAEAYARSQRVSMQDSIDHLMEVVRFDLLTGSSNAESRKKVRSSWQDLSARDIRAIFHNDLQLATPHGRERIENLQKFYPTDKLKRINIPGPNQTTIYILSEPKHERLFDEQLKSVVEQQRPKIEGVIAERMQARPLLDKSLVEQGLFRQEISQFHITTEERERLNRLQSWRTNGN